MAVWALDNNASHPGYLCRIPILAETYITNNQAYSTMITRLKVEALDRSGQWRQLSIVDTLAMSPFYKGSDLRHAREETPVDGKFLDRQIAGQNIGPGETVNGWLFMDQDISEDIRGPFRFSIVDLQGRKYEIGPIDVDAIGALEGGFMAGKITDLSSLKQEKCFLWSWK